MRALARLAALAATTISGVAVAAAIDGGAPGPAANSAATAAEPPARPLAIVATVGMVGDLARQIGGDRVRVHDLMGEGVDPHLYKASPGDVRLLSDADMILFCGLHLEGRMSDLITRMAGRRTVVQVTESIDESRLREPPEFEGHFDPHVWFDASLWRTAAERVRDALVEKDPAGRAVYQANAAEYLALLDELHAYAAQTLGTIPAAARVMVTAHDAFGYFGRAYGLEVLAIQGISTDSEASLRDINALVDTLVSRKVPAVFIESSVPRKTIDALVEGCAARGHRVVIGGELFSDAMGRPGTLEGTYAGMVLHNVDAVTRALGGRVPETRTGRLGAFASKFNR